MFGTSVSNELFVQRKNDRISLLAKVQKTA